MITEFKLLFDGEPDIEIDKFQKSLPPSFRVETRNDGIYVAIESAFSEDERCQYLIDRELDRHLFMTCVRIRSEMLRTKMSSSFKASWRVHSSLPDDIRPQKWNYQLPIQLRLWSSAANSTDPTTKLLLLFQIIELAYPKRIHYPEYQILLRVLIHLLNASLFVILWRTVGMYPTNS
ncbi:MAG: hypothetical protein ACXV7F_01340 [Methylomonas sp.]